MSGPIEIGEVARMLDARAGEIAAELLPNGRRHGPEWRTGSIADEPGQSLAVRISGAKQGLWTDFSDSGGVRATGGDMLKLVAAVLFGGDLKPAFAWAKARLGLDGMDHRRMATVRAQAQERSRTADEAAARQAETMRRKAVGIWIGARALDGSPAELYLATRGIDLSLLHALPGAIRYNPAVWCAEVGRELPALVAAVVALDGTHVATHRIWLEPDGAGGARKHAGLAEPKKAIGRFWEGHVPLNKGAERCTLREVSAGTVVAIAEGIEDGLTAACACPELRTVAAVTLGNIAAMALPEQVRELVIVGQNDPAGSPADRTLRKAIAQRQAEGRTVRLARPAAGFKDVNDLATGTMVPVREEAA